MRYKIQIQTVDGWSDLRESYGTGKFDACFFPSRMHAVRAYGRFSEMCEHLENLRIVPASVPETETCNE